MKAWWLAGLIAVAASAAEPGINWVKSYDEGLATSQTNGQPMLVDFYANWCGWCRVMDGEVYTNPRVVQLLRGYVCVKVDVDRDQKTALKFQISSMPRTIVFDKRGEVTGDLLGYVDADRFSAFLEGITSNETTATALVALAEPGVADAPEQLIGFLGSPDPKIRAKASAVLIATGQPAVPALVTALSSDYLGTRLAAHAALRRITGMDIDFDAWAAKSDREQAAARWRALLKQQPPSLR